MRIAARCLTRPVDAVGLQRLFSASFAASFAAFLAAFFRVFSLFFPFDTAFSTRAHAPRG
ncbi:hypothetical protein [Paraburkholderia tropica]|uniref:hypothetical protein n=1 Tax=Paraburkholderia tropica TaxID=92647 RepID=UPI001591EA9B|nr:hypothetical protein [Paraburkholderia tropica]